MRALLVIYDNGSYLHTFPMGMGYVASVLRAQGVTVDVYSQDMHHYPDEHLTDFLNKNKYDLVGVSLIAGYYQYAKLLKISAAINASRQRPYYIIGGYGPTPEPEFFLRKTGADCLVLGEGEHTTLELLEALSGKRSFESVMGIAWMKDGNPVINPRRGLIENIDSIEMPAYDLFPMHYYRLYRPPRASTTDFAIPMMSGRGCIFECTFCYRMDPGFRPRSPEAIVEEMRYLKTEFGISRVSFYDDLLMVSVKRTEEICEAFEKANLGMTWDCNGRLNYATPALLKRMRDCGCVFINYGIEAMDNTVLKNMKKGLRTDMIVKGVEATIDVGISPGLNIIFGNVGDNLQTLQAGVDFLLKYDDASQMRSIRPVTPYPGSPLYYTAIEKGLLDGPEDFYERKHLNSDLLAVNFTDLSNDEFYEGLKSANKQLAKHHFDRRSASLAEQITALYDKRDPSFRGFRHSG